MSMLCVMTADAQVTVRVGPVAVEPARLWIEHERRNLAILRANVEKLPFHVPAEVIDLIGAYLDEWRCQTSGDGPFTWAATMDRHELELVVRYWANLDLMTDDLVDRVGVAWAPTSTRPFFDALVAGVDAALRTDGGAPDPFVRTLARSAVSPPGGTAGARPSRTREAAPARAPREGR